MVLFKFNYIAFLLYKIYSRRDDMESLGYGKSFLHEFMRSNSVDFKFI